MGKEGGNRLLAWSTKVHDGARETTQRKMKGPDEGKPRHTWGIGHFKIPVKAAETHTKSQKGTPQ